MSTTGMGNRQSTAGHIGCIIFSAGHINFQIEIRFENTQWQGPRHEQLRPFIYFLQIDHRDRSQTCFCVCNIHVSFAPRSFSKKMSQLFAIYRTSLIIYRILLRGFVCHKNAARCVECQAGFLYIKIRFCRPNLRCGLCGTHNKAGRRLHTSVPYYTGRLYRCIIFKSIVPTRVYCEDRCDLTFINLVCSILLSMTVNCY